MMISISPSLVLLLTLCMTRIDEIHTCGGGGGSKECTYRKCVENSYSAYSPYPSQGSCVWQTSYVSHHYQTHKKSSGCHDSLCTGRDQTRVLCSCRQVTSCYWASWNTWSGYISTGTCGRHTRYRQGRSSYQYVYRVDGCGGVTGTCWLSTQAEQRTSCSCLQATNCWWASWGAWTGSISPGTCGKQNRYRQGRASYRYVDRVGSCNGVKSSCAQSSDSEQRQWCNCRHAEKCTAAQWSAWLPQVGNGKCVSQTRYHDKIPTYKYYQQKDHCGGYVANCPGRVTDRRTYCSCEYKECVQGEWTSWEIHSWTGNCPNQRRLRHYRSITKYQYGHGNCIGIGPKSCPNPVDETREKEVTCPKLPIPANGKHIDAACDGANSKCQAACRMECNQGYKIQGRSYVTCKGDGKWDQQQATCKDSTPPSIKCPTVSTHYTAPNENYAMVDLPDATGSDNSGKAVTITKDKPSPLKILGGTSVQVTYTATDPDGNSKSCKIQIEVKDNEAPKVRSCPGDKFVSTGTFPHKHYWDEPTFHDNVDGENVAVIPSHTPGSNFYKGKHVITYTARDKALNTVKCSFTLEVEMAKCPITEPPKHGSAQCNIKKDGIHEAFICTVSCKEGSWFLQGENIPKLYNFYVCGYEGEWRGQNIFNPMAPTAQFVPIPKDKPMWPDCAVGASPDGVVLDFHVFGGSCKDKAQMEKLKQDFLNAIKADLIVNSLFCVNYQQNCIIENIQVYCASRKRRSTGGSGSGNQVVIKFSYAVRDKNLAGKSAVDVNKLSSMTSLLNAEKPQLLKKLQTTAPNVLKDYSSSVTADNPVVGCEPGYEYNVVNGTGDVHVRTKCLKCPRGTFYNQNTKKCTVCQQGFYQDKEGQLSCKKCASGKSTVGKFGHDFHECKGICQPGTYSSNGLETCIACPLGTYQPMSYSTSCMKCPAGTTTSTVGSARVSDCSKPAIDYKIHSEGCSDPGINGCGRTNILVSNKDHSLHRRGINFVALDAKTGQHIGSASFDWHGHASACLNSYKWISALRNEVIVLAGYQDEATLRYDNNYCKRALLLIGGKEPFQTEYRASFALVGYKGAQRNVNWIRQKKSSAGRGPTDLNGSIELF